MPGRGLGRAEPTSVLQEGELEAAESEQKRCCRRWGDLEGNAALGRRLGRALAGRPVERLAGRRKRAGNPVETHRAGQGGGGRAVVWKPPAGGRRSGAAEWKRLRRRGRSGGGGAFGRLLAVGRASRGRRHAPRLTSASDLSVPGGCHRPRSPPGLPARDHPVAPSSAKPG